MTRHSWMERLTPFTGGAAIALLVMALVVQPVWADGTYNTCTQCLNYWEYKLTRNKTCGTWSTQSEYYAWRNCMEDNKRYNCVGQEGSGMACPGKELPDTLKDCGSDACNFYAGIPNASVCQWDCWGRPCANYLLNGEGCRDVPKDCDLKGPSTACFECKCTNY